MKVGEVVSAAQAQEATEKASLVVIPNVVRNPSFSERKEKEGFFVAPLLRMTTLTSFSVAYEACATNSLIALSARHGILNPA